MSDEARKEKWFRMKYPDGGDYIVSPQGVKQILGICDMTRRMGYDNRRIDDLERRIEQLETPVRRAKIIETLWGQGWHNATWIRNRTKLYSSDLEALTDQKQIDRKKGRLGLHTMYRCGPHEVELRKIDRKGGE